MKLAPLAAYRIWAESYDEMPNPVTALERRLLAPLLGNVRGKRVLDAGCGTGRWLAWARARGASVIGLDFCANMLARAGTKPGLAQRVALADLRHAPLADASVDLAVCAFCLSYVDDPARALAELWRVVRPGGSVLVSDFHPEARRAGWTRSFRAGGVAYEIEDHPYGVERLTAAGLPPQRILEGCFGEPERELFARAGKADWFARTRGVRAVLIARWER